MERLRRYVNHLSGGSSQPVNRTSIHHITKDIRHLYGKWNETIEAELRAAIRDPKHLTIQPKQHVTDRSHHASCHTDAIVYPTTNEEISAILRICNKNVVPVTTRTTGTGLEGGSLPYTGGVLLDLSKMNKILQYREKEMLITVQPGVTKLELGRYLDKLGLFFPVDPASNAGIGGYASTGASGTLSVKYRTMRESVVTLKVVLANGDIIDTRRRTVKSSAGYNLTQLFIGAEGTLGVICEITVRVRRKPAAILSAAAVFKHTAQAADTVIQLTSEDLTSLARAELLNSTCVEAVNRHSGTRLAVSPTLLLEFHGASQQEVENAALIAQRVSREQGCLAFNFTSDPKEGERLWQARRDAYFAVSQYRKGQGLRMISTDVCVPVPHLATAIQKTEEEFEKSPLRTRIPCAVVGHVGDGNFHCMVPYNAEDKEEVAEVERLIQRSVDIALELGGTCSGEHGVGVGKMGAVLAEHGPVVVGLMRSVKKAVDPNYILNPNKIFTRD